MIPEKLKVGDEVRIIAPSRSMNIIGKETIEVATNRFEKMGLKVTYGKYVNEADEYYGTASIEHRVEDIKDAFLDKNVKAIFTIIGGFNSNQILKYIDYEIIKQNPKILCGYSDITAILSAINTKTGLVTYYGPHFSTFGEIKGFDYTQKYFNKMFFQTNEFEIKSSNEWSSDSWFIDQENRNFIKNEGMIPINNGNAEGEIVGGNLSTFDLLKGTEFMPDIKNKILFLEYIGEDRKEGLLTIDRLLQGIIHLPNFKYVKGLVLGRAIPELEMTDDKWKKMIKEKIELKNIPVIANCDFGHTTPMFTFPIGGAARLEVKDDKIKLSVKG